MPEITDRSTLRETLQALTKDQIQPRALHCASPLPTRKGELIDVIISAVNSPDQLRVLWEKLDALSRKAVAAALENGGKLDQDAFRAQYDLLPWDKAKRKSQWSHVREYLPVEVFMYFGRIPPDVVPLLKPLAPQADKFILSGADTLPDGTDLLIAETEEPALHDLVATLSLIAEGKAAISPNTAHPTAATLIKLSGRFLHGEYLPASRDEPVKEPIRAFGWLTLAQIAKLAKPAGSKLDISPKGKKVLAQPDIEDVKDAFEAWAHSNQFDELSRIQALKGQKKARLTRPTERKRRLIEALSQCPTDQWIGIEEFFRAVRAWRCDFEIEISGWVDRLYVGSSWEYGYLSGFGAEASWRAEQAQYILACLWEYLATMGTLDIAYQYPEDATFKIPHIGGIYDEPYFSRYIGLAHFRINPLGAYLLNHADTYAGPARSADQPVFTVTPNQEVVITRRDQFTPNIRTLLERLSDEAGEGVYKPNREKILTALETGLTLEAVVDFLTTKSAHPLPQTVSVWLDDIQRNSQALKEIGPAMLFSVADPALASLLANDTKLKEICSLVGETRLVVPAEKEAGFRRRVKQLGFGIRP